MEIDYNVSVGTFMKKIDKEMEVDYKVPPTQPT